MKAYAGAILRVNLSSGRISEEHPPEELWRECLGGVGLGARLLYQSMQPQHGWDAPENLLVLATGPLAGLPVWGGSGTTVVTRGPMTGGATSSQANGFFAVNLKSSGYDAVVIEGQAAQWQWLWIHQQHAELRDARQLLGLDTWQLQQRLEEETGWRGHQLSVFSSGVAGENRVRFAAMHCDYGHVASKNGCGAVMGAKRLKAIVAARGDTPLRVHDADGLMRAADQVAYQLRTDASSRGVFQYGTLPAVMNLQRLGVLPIKNYTTNEFPSEANPDEWEAAALRTSFEHRGHQCGSCGMHHCQQHVLTEGPGKGQLVDEPEYEGWSGAGFTLGVTDKNHISWLNNQIDRACVDINEFGWIAGWMMECFERNLVSKDLLDGLEPRWGDIHSALKLLEMMVHRSGFGDVLAEGTKHAAEYLGGKAQAAAIYTHKGATPRGHDHRGRWDEMLDTCVASTGTLEAGLLVAPHELGLPARINPFDPHQVATQVAKLLGRRHFEDSIGACIFTTRTEISLICQALNAATGWNFTVEEAMRMGKRTACWLRAFNIRCGILPNTELPSSRYASKPHNGPAKGTSALENWETMIEHWYNLTRFDRKSGLPSQQLLQQLGMDELLQDLWGTPLDATPAAKPSL